MPTYGITAQGLVLPRAIDLLDQIRTEYEVQAGLVGAVDWSPDTVLGVLSAVVAEQGGTVVELLQAIYDSRDSNNATGVQADAIASLAGVFRRSATRSTNTASLTGTAGTVVPAGSVVEYLDDNSRFETTAEVTIPDDVEIQAVDTGPIGPVTSSGAWRIITPVAGWDDLTTSNPVVGRKQETTSELLLRRDQSFSTQEGGTLPALLGSLLRLPFVDQAIALENTSDETAVVEGLTLPAKSVAPIIYVKEGVAVAADMAQAIYDHLGGGVQSDGDESGTVTTLGGRTKTLYWREAVEVPVTVDMEVGVAAPLSQETQDAIEADVEAYFDQLTLGEPVIALRIIGIVAAYEEVGLTVVEVNGDEISIEIDPTQIAVFFNLNISEITAP